VRAELEADGYRDLADQCDADRSHQRPVREARTDQVADGHANAEQHQQRRDRALRVVGDVVIIGVM
jgi:hypothetical protein